MISPQATAVINRPAEQVFSFVADVRNMHFWCEGLVEAKQTSPQPLAKGATFHETFRVFLGRKGGADYEITEFDLNKRFAFASTSGPVRQKDIMVFDSVEGGTRVTHRNESQFARFRFLEPLFKGMAQRKTESDLAALKAHLEKQPAV